MKKLIDYDHIPDSRMRHARALGWKPLEEMDTSVLLKLRERYDEYGQQLTAEIEKRTINDRSV